MLMIPANDQLISPVTTVFLKFSWVKWNLDWAEVMVGQDGAGG